MRISLQKSLQHHGQQLTRQLLKKGQHKAIINQNDHLILYHIQSIHAEFHNPAEHILAFPALIHHF